MTARELSDALNGATPDELREIRRKLFGLDEPPDQTGPYPWPITPSPYPLPWAPAYPWAVPMLTPPWVVTCNTMTTSTGAWVRGATQQ